MKKLASILLAILMVALLSSAAMALEGAGTSASPYLIKDLADLKAFRDDVNGGNSYSGKYVQLDADINLNNEAWVPIGNGTRASSSYSGNAFAGVFDGNDKTISGLKMTTTLTNEDIAMGLFGVVDGGTVKNVTLSNVNINISNGDNVGAAVGVLVGDGLVSGVTVSGSVKGADGIGGVVGRMMKSGTIENCTNNATVEATSTAAGGVVGKAYYTAAGKEMNIISCSNSGNVTGVYAAGGIAGLSASNVMQCENSGTIAAGTEAGGIIGEQVNYGEVTDNKNSGSVKSTVAGEGGHGGIIGWVRYQGNASYANNEVIVVSGNINSASIITLNRSAGGIVGLAYNQIIATGNTNTADTIQGKVFAAGIVGGLQNDNANLTITNSPKQFVVTNNISKTASANITANCTRADAYVNDPAASYVIENNGDGEFVAVVGGKYYMDLQAAVNAADGKTVKLLQSIELTETVTIASGKTVTLDLNGKVLSGLSTEAKSSAVITNKGTLTIQDSSNAGTGTITASAKNPDTGDIPKYANNTVNNYGTLTLKSGTIQNATESGRACYPIDNYDKGIVNIKGGTVTGRGAIRMFANNTSGTNTVNITGGTVTGTSYAVWIQNPSDGSAGNNTKNPAAELYITGGTVAKLLIEPSTKFSGSITGGTFTGTIAYWEPDTDDDRNLSGFISGGKFVEKIDDTFIKTGHTLVKKGSYYYVGKAYKVTFNPADATIVVKDSEGNVMEANNGVYTLLNGDYTYTANKAGYREATGSFSVINADRTVDVTLPTIDANAPSIIDDTLISATYVQGETAKALSVTAQPNGDGVLTYQWYVVSNHGITTPIEGATESTYVPKTDEVGVKAYFCVVTNTYDSATGEKTAFVETEEANITVTAKAGEHIAHILVTGREGVSYKKVTAYMVELGKTAKFNEKTLEQLPDTDVAQYSYTQAAKDGKYNMVITATLADDTEVTTTTLIDLEGHDDDHEVTLPDAMRSSTVEDSTNTGIIAGGVEDVAEKVDTMAKELGVEIKEDEHVEVELKIEKNAETKEDAAEITEQAAQDGKHVEMTINIDLLLKKIKSNGQQDGAAYDLGNVNKTMLTILIPFDLGGRAPQNFVMYRMHNGKLEVIPQAPKTDKDATTECFEVYEDHIELNAYQFSTYTLAYGEDIVVDLPQTGDNTNMALWLAMLGMSMLALCGAALRRRIN